MHNASGLLGNVNPLGLEYWIIRSISRRFALFNSSYLTHTGKTIKPIFGDLKKILKLKVYIGTFNITESIRNISVKYRGGF